MKIERMTAEIREAPFYRQRYVALYSWPARLCSVVL